ncbi:unnamed protein product [Pleuronectes platessa]|uniref:Uncharacterized protein n=1 Tax=Pleuronectes platessa TaxID=8262 RepID=A0A9N7YUZ3_PLEPL|nr:unnamed protein product [Pleuronectes platessa]
MRSPKKAQSTETGDNFSARSLVPHGDLCWVEPPQPPPRLMLVIVVLVLVVLVMVVLVLVVLVLVMVEKREIFSLLSFLLLASFTKLSPSYLRISDLCRFSVGRLFFRVPVFPRHVLTSSDSCHLTVPPPPRGGEALQTELPFRDGRRSSKQLDHGSPGGSSRDGYEYNHQGLKDNSLIYYTLVLHLYLRPPLLSLASCSCLNAAFANNTQTCRQFFARLPLKLIQASALTLEESHNIEASSAGVLLCSLAAGTLLRTRPDIIPASRAAGMSRFAHLSRPGRQLGACNAWLCSPVRHGRCIASIAEAARRMRRRNSNVDAPGGDPAPLAATAWRSAAQLSRRDGSKEGRRFKVPLSKAQNPHLLPVDCRRLSL